MLNEWLKTTLFNLFDYDLTIGRILGCVFATIVILALTRLALIALKNYGDHHRFEKPSYLFIKRLIYLAGFLLWLILCMLSLHLNPSIYLSESSGPTLTYINIITAILLIVVARIADKLISSRLLEELDSQMQRDIYKDQYGQKNKSNITRIVQYALFILVLTFVISSFGLDQTFYLGEKDTIPISISRILVFLLVLLIARLLLWFTINIFLYGWYKREKIDLGKQYAYNQLLSYVIYFFAVIIAVQSMGINLTLLLAGAAALLVGVGIALQQVISDFFSGLVILFERSVEVGDFLEFESYKGTVKKIGLRASVVETLESKDIIIPNSYLVNEKVTNWSGTRITTRFDVSVGTAYGSDTSLVKELLLEAAENTEGVLTSPSPFVRFTNFGDSSLDFMLYFFSDRVRTIENVKSNLRFKIDALFRENNVQIPFPQRDIWFKNKQPPGNEGEQ